MVLAPSENNLEGVQKERGLKDGTNRLKDKGNEQPRGVIFSAGRINRKVVLQIPTLLLPLNSSQTQGTKACGSCD